MTADIRCVERPAGRHVTVGTALQALTGQLGTWQTGPDRSVTSRQISKTVEYEFMNCHPNKLDRILKGYSMSRTPNKHDKQKGNPTKPNTESQATWCRKIMQDYLRPNHRTI